VRRYRKGIRRGPRSSSSRHGDHRPAPMGGTQAVRRREGSTVSSCRGGHRKPGTGAQGKHRRNVRSEVGCRRPALPVPSPHGTADPESSSAPPDRACVEPFLIETVTEKKVVGRVHSTTSTYGHGWTRGLSPPPAHGAPGTFASTVDAVQLPRRTATAAQDSLRSSESFRPCGPTTGAGAGVSIR